MRYKPASAYKNSILKTSYNISISSFLYRNLISLKKNVFKIKNGALATLIYNSKNISDSKQLFF